MTGRHLAAVAVALAVAGCQWFLVFDQKLTPSATAEGGADASSSGDGGSEIDGGSRADGGMGADGGVERDSGLCAGDYVLCEDFERPETNDPWALTEVGGALRQWVDAGADGSAGAVRFDVPPPSGQVYLLSKSLPSARVLDCGLKLRYEVSAAEPVDVNVCGVRSGAFELAMDIFQGELELKPSNGNASGPWAQLAPGVWHALRFVLGSTGVVISRGGNTAPPFPLALTSPMAAPQIWIGASVSNAGAPPVSVWVDDLRCAVEL